MPKPYTVYASHIDNRQIKCACGSPDCKRGLAFDSNPAVMILTDKYGNEHSMRLDKSNVRELIKILREYQQAFKEA